MMHRAEAIFLERVNSPTLVFSVMPVQRNLPEKLSAALSLKMKSLYLGLWHAPKPPDDFLVSNLS